MKLYYCVRSIERVPSCMYNIRMLNDMGYDIKVVVGETSGSINKVLDDNGIDYVYGCMKQNTNSIKSKLYVSLKYRKYLKNALKDSKLGDYIFFGTADSAIHAIGIKKRLRYILCLKELYDTSNWLYKSLIGYVSKRSSGIICCEKNRSRIIKWRYKLSKTPYTLPNKPYGYPTERIEPQIEQTKNIINEINGRSFILYQSRYIGYKYELVNLAKALKMLDREVILLVVGALTDESIKDRINDIYSKTIWAGHIPAPHHMEITGYAKMGIAVYADDKLNNLFCAPNKTYEYAGFGIPSLCNDLPALESSVGVAKAGKCVNWNDIDAISSAIKEIISNYEEYSKNAKKFFDSENSSEKLKKILNDIIGTNI